MLDKSADLKSLVDALSLYSQTTDGLIKLFVKTQDQQSKSFWLNLSDKIVKKSSMEECIFGYVMLNFEC